jgi:triacylglycerol lipase
MLMERHGTSAFPELDPATGLPLTRQMSAEEDRHLQRTISEQWRRGTDAPKPLFGGLPMPSMPALPTFKDVRKSVDGQRRQLSTSTSAFAQRMFSTSKGRIDSMLSEEDQAPTKEEEAAKHQIKYQTPKNPIVLCHGLLGFDFLGPANLPALQISHWRGIREVLEKSGCEVLICRVPATGSIMERAEVLHNTIKERFPGRTVNLIAHSMGGLDCRYLASQIRPTEFDICSLTTISTPHRGSPFADYVIDNVIGRDRLAQLLGLMQAMDLPNSGDGAAFTALGTRAMKEFNTEVVDHPNVKYYSWGAAYDAGLFDTFRWPWSVIYAKEGPNDGMVSVSSAKWGEYRGTLLGVNHLDLIGWVNQLNYMMSSLTGKPIEFKPATFYLEVVSGVFCWRVPAFEGILEADTSRTISRSRASSLQAYSLDSNVFYRTHSCTLFSKTQYVAHGKRVHPSPSKRAMLASLSGSM